MRFHLMERAVYLLLGQAFALLMAAISYPLPFVLALMLSGGLISITGLLLLKWQIRVFDRNSRDQPLKSMFHGFERCYKPHLGRHKWRTVLRHSLIRRLRALRFCKLDCGQVSRWTYVQALRANRKPVCGKHDQVESNGASNVTHVNKCAARSCTDTIHGPLGATIISRE